MAPNYRMAWYTSTTKTVATHNTTVDLSTILTNENDQIVSRSASTDGPIPSGARISSDRLMNKFVYHTYGTDIWKVSCGEVNVKVIVRSKCIYFQQHLLIRPIWEGAQWIPILMNCNWVNVYHSVILYFRCYNITVEDMNIPIDIIIFEAD